MKSSVPISHSATRLPKFRRTRKVNILPYVFISPLLLFIGAMALYPTALTFIESFYKDNPLDPPVRFGGLQNYIDIFTNPSVTYSWGNTLIYVVIGVGLSTILAILLSLGIWENFSARSIVLAILILPWALPGITEGIIWSWIYDPNFGVLNSVLHSLHISKSNHLWISGSRWRTIFFIELVQVWQITPLSTILILTGLQSIPHELYDASRTDGANRYQTLFRVTLPLIRPGIAVAVVQALIACLNIFDQPFVLNGNALTGGSVMLQDYNITFQNLDFGQGYALSFIVVSITMIISIGLLRTIYKKVEY